MPRTGLSAHSPLSSDLERELAELFGQADAGRALGIFSDVLKARQWLDQMA